MIDFGLSNRISVPIPGPTGCFGVGWFSGPKMEITAKSISAIHFLAPYAFERLRTLVGWAPDVRGNLTARECEVLTWVAQGKYAWEIGEILGIAKRTVDEHIQTVMRKIGAVNRT
jgi:LuxR family quorum sensing-dependent transcriptional regulator